MLRMGRKRGLLLVWLVVFLLLAVPLYGQSILTQAVSGTGFIVGSNGYIITNKHVVNGATQISVTIGSKEYEARVVDSLSDNDIALLKIDAHGLSTVLLGDSDEVQIGDTVYAIGCPAGVCGTITAGRIANLGITSKTDEGTTLHNLIMSDLTTTHGSSGGPLLNDKGEVIGITTAGVVVQGETTGFGVSIPINQAMPLLREVPGFSTAQMGKATTVLSFDEIRSSVGPETAFVQAEVQRVLTDFLPKEALGVRLDVSAVEGFLSLGFLPSASAYAHVRSGQVSRFIDLKVRQYGSAEEAHNYRRNALDPPSQAQFYNKVVLENLKSIGDINLTIRSGVGLSGLISGSITAYGCAAFTLGKLLFIITLSDDDTLEIYMPCEEYSNVSWETRDGRVALTYEYQSLADQLSPWGNPPTERVYQSSINMDSFLHDFQELIDVVINNALVASGSQ